MKNLFINPVERRLRAGWRLLAQWILFFLVNTMFAILFGIVAAGLALSRGQDITDPSVLMGLMLGPAGQLVSRLGSLLAIVVSYLVASRWLDRRPLADFGFHFNRRWWEDLAFGLALGALLMGLIYVFERAAGWVTVTGTMQNAQPGDFWGSLLLWLLIFLAVGIYEEMLSRGYQLRNLAEGLNVRAVGPRVALLLAYLISSSIFGLLHALNPNASLVSTVNLIIAGLFLGLGYILTGQLAIPIGLHITWNFFQGNVFGFPVSGMNTGASFLAIQQGGPDLWTGGAFGPEAGLIGLAAIALGSLLTVLWVRWRAGRAELQDRLAVYRVDMLQSAPPPTGNSIEIGG